MMKKKKFPIYYFKFLDHSLTTPSNAGLIPCEVFGVLAKEDKYAYYVAAWVCNSNLADDNNEVYSIAKSTVLRKKRLA